MALADIRKVTDVALFVSDVARAVDFYQDKLGLALKRRDTGFAEFYLDGIVLALWQADDFANALNLPLGRPPTQRRGPHAMLAIRLESPDAVDAHYSELSARGVPFAGPPADHPWNARAAYFTDPDDNVWELYCWLGAPRTL